MKLCRYYSADEVKPAIFSEAVQLLDVSFFGEDFDEKFFATNGPQRLKEWISSHKELMDVVELPYRLAPPFYRPSKIICVGLNYREHAVEVAASPPSEPVLFYKSTSAMAGCNDPVWMPKGCDRLDYEVELGVVIGKGARRVSEKEAMDYVAGYVLTNDYSEREFQLERKGQWLKGKSHDSFAPFGPYMITKEEVKDPHSLSIWLEVNGERRQEANTGDMVFSIPFLVSYISQFMSLLPGDVICTGTPSGVGMGSMPPKYLKVGDQVSYGITGLGKAVQTVKNMPVDEPLPFSLPASATALL